MQTERSSRTLTLPNLRSGEGSPMEPRVPWRMFTLSPLLPFVLGGSSGWVFLGEVESKIVGVSAVRFQSIGVQQLGAEAAAAGSCVTFEVSLVSAEEVILVAAVSPKGVYLTREIGQRHGSICE